VRGNPDRFAEVAALNGVEACPVPERVVEKLAQTVQVVSVTIRDVHADTRMISLREILRTTGIVPFAVERASFDHAWEAHPPSWFLDSLVHKGDVLLGGIVAKFSEESPKIDGAAHPFIASRMKRSSPFSDGSALMIQ
jgi:hypothetical protein